MLRDLIKLQRLLHHLKLSSEELNHLQNLKLRNIIRHAYENVPYYQSLFSSGGLSPEDIRSVEDLKYIPITTKEDLKAAGIEKITTQGISLSSYLQISTSGNTGKPFTVYFRQDEARIRQLLDFRTLLSIGFHPRDRLLSLIRSFPYHTRFYQRLGFYRSENISHLHLIEEQVQHLQKMRPTILWASPTELWALLHHLDDHLSKIIRPRIIIISAEVFSEGLKERIRADLDIEIFNFYGAVEAGRIASECPSHEGLHVNADHLILECLVGDQPAGFGKPGVVVITTLNAFVMPFIRYRLGDICSLIDKRCSCGASFPLIGPIQGRENDMVQLPSGKILSPHGLNNILMGINEINQFRFIQKSPGHLVLQLALCGNLSEEKLLDIRTQCMEYLCEPIHLDIQTVDFIQDGMFKFKTFIGLNKTVH